VPESTIHLLVKGRVQGVGFRWHVADEARRLGLAGWVRNNSDGSVELCAQGDEKALAGLRGIVGKGPNGATVSDVESLGSAPVGEMPRPFSIARQ
jgi:Acylphosphatases